MPASVSRYGCRASGNNSRLSLRVRQLGGRVVYDHELRGEKNAPAPTWLQSLVGKEGFGIVRQVWLSDSNARDGDLIHLVPCLSLSFWT